MTSKSSDKHSVTTHALIDADLVAFRCAASANKEVVEVALLRVDALMERLLYETNASSHTAYLTGSGNFRKDIYPEYKANRTSEPPQWLQQCREQLVMHWGAKITEGIEADDALGIEQTRLGLESVVVSLDKDLLQIPGYHYQWEIGGVGSTGKQWVKEAKQWFITPFEGLRHFYAQVITGDAADHVPAFDGKFRTSTPKFVQELLEPLKDMTSAPEMWEYVQDIYSEQVSWADDWLSIAERNAKVLYIQKYEGEMWQPPCLSLEATSLVGMAKEQP